LTLHANTADQAIERIVHFFPDERRKQILLDLSLNLRAVIAQQLIPSASGEGRELAAEVLVNTPLVSEMLRKNKIHEIKGLMGRTNQEGMCTFDQALYHLYTQDRITMDEAIIHADSPNEIKLMIKLNNGDISTETAAGVDKLSLEDL
jgi:twitching motility protein PilU